MSKKKFYAVGRTLCYAENLTDYAELERSPVEPEEISRAEAIRLARSARKGTGYSPIVYPAELVLRGIEPRIGYNGWTCDSCIATQRVDITDYEDEYTRRC